VVKKEGASSRHFKEVFLEPGQELNFNNNDFSYQLTSIDKTAPRHNQPKVAKAPSKPIPALLNFDNQPLSDIFSELQKQYNIKIIFKTGTLEDLRFTGTHNPGSESLEDFLNTIAILNDLKVEKKPNAFIITPN
jgi:ferric-dicitrate binding protein FerR (iron transport regulator)